MTTLHQEDVRNMIFVAYLLKLLSKVKQIWMEKCQIEEFILVFTYQSHFYLYTVHQLFSQNLVKLADSSDDTHDTSSIV
jgi:hypothetical protein